MFLLLVVRELQLKGNQLGPAGVIALATALPRNVALAVRASIVGVFCVTGPVALW